jgi:hypothetical protein
VPPRELVGHHPSGVVPVVCMLAAGISQARDEEIERRGMLTPTEEAQGLLLV